MLKWTGIVLLIFIAGISAITAGRQDVKYEAIYPDIKAVKDSAVIAKGRHLVYDIAHCADCHSTLNTDSVLKLGQEVPLTGGFKFELPIGDIYSKNITSDKETGIGKYSDAEIARVLRYGVLPNGNAVFDFMPFHDMSDEDMTAVISYLRTQKPVSHKVPDHNMNVMGKLVKAFMVKPVGPTGEVPKSVKADTSASYGRYLVTSIAECSGCHTKRDMSGGYIGAPFAGGNEMEFGLVTPNLTTDSSSRIFNWSVDAFIKRFRQGKLIPYSPMPWNSFKRMSDDELKAIYNFLKTVPPAKMPPVK